MTIERVLAQMTVTDLPRAQHFYTRLFGRGPDAAPMEGLREWHLGEAMGVQVWSEAARAGRSTMVLKESELDERAAELARAGIVTRGPEPGGGVRILSVEDPDGNRIVFAGR